MSADASPDLPHRLAVALLGHINERLAALDASPRRAYVCPDVGVPSDDCCNGTAWVRVATIIPTDGSTNQLRDLYPAVTSVPFGWAITYEAGILRCAPTVRENGLPPTVDAMSDAAERVAQDRLVLMQAVSCDFAADLIAADVDGHVPGAWLPLLTGNCVGGWITTTVGTTISGVQ